MSGTITRNDLQSLYKNHWARLEGLDEPDTQHVVGVAFECDGEVGDWIQFQWGLMNAAKLNDEQLSVWRNIIEDEGLTIDYESDVSITTFDPELQDASRLAELTERMLHEIYDRKLEDLVSIEEGVL